MPIDSCRPFLGAHSIRQGIKPSPEKKEAINKFEIPKTRDY